MIRNRAEKLGSIFLVVFSVGLAGQLARDGMEPAQWIGAGLAVAGSVSLAWMVHAWKRPARAPSRGRRR